MAGLLPTPRELTPARFEDIEARLRRLERARNYAGGCTVDADSYASLAAAVAACDTRGGGTVCLSPGTSYSVSGDLTVTNLVIVHGHWSGRGGTTHPGASVIAVTGSTDDVWSFDVGLRDLVVDVGADLELDCNESVRHCKFVLRDRTTSGDGLALYGNHNQDITVVGSAGSPFVFVDQADGLTIDGSIDVGVHVGASVTRLRTDSSAAVSTLRVDGDAILVAARILVDDINLDSGSPQVTACAFTAAGSPSSTFVDVQGGHLTDCRITRTGSTGTGVVIAAGAKAVVAGNRFSGFATNVTNNDGANSVNDNNISAV